jgi:ornithine decarboxylase
MSLIETVPHYPVLDYAISGSPSCPESTHSCHEKYNWNANDALSGEILADSASFNQHPLHRLSQNGEQIFPSLPPLLRGHPEVHLRNGVMQAARLAAENEPDAEKAFFVADLTRVYMQHHRFKNCLPEIQPFYGTYLPLNSLSNPP